MRYSNVMFAVTLTQLGQTVISIPYQLWLDKEKYNIYGEGGYQKFNFLYYGIGNNEPPSYHEKYYIDFSRFRIAALKRVYPHTYAGFRYVFDNSTLLKLDTAGELIKHTIPGSTGGIVSQIGATLKYDNRDNQFYASKGYYLEVFGLTANPATGSAYTFSKLSVDASTYVALPRKQIIAFNAYGVATVGNVPFYHMALLGGNAKLRGMYTGRYRDKDCWVLQAEYRAHLFWRLGAVVFGGIGEVAPQFSQFSVGDVHYSYGAGVRGNIDRKQHLNARFDVGISNNQYNYYFTIGEAF